jgi:hypothetical protein
MAYFGRLIPHLVSPLFGATYEKKIRNLFGSSSFVAFWPLTESSGTTIYDISGNGRNGTYIGPTLANAAPPKGNKPIPLFDGVNDFGVLYSASLNTGMNKDEGTLYHFAKVYDASCWAGAFRTAIMLRADADNYVYSRISSLANAYQMSYKAGGTDKGLAFTISSLAWNQYGFSWSKAADQVKYYINGSQSGATQTSLGTWVGDISSTYTNLGANANTPSQTWYGWLASMILLNRPATATEFSRAYTLV